MYSLLLSGSAPAVHPTAVSPAVGASQVTDSSTTPFLLTVEEGEQHAPNERDSATLQPLPSEGEQPLMDSLQAQFDYRKNLNTDRAEQLIPPDEGDIQAAPRWAVGRREPDNQALIGLQQPATERETPPQHHDKPAENQALYPDSLVAMLPFITPLEQPLAISPTPLHTDAGSPQVGGTMVGSSGSLAADTPATEPLALIVQPPVLPIPPLDVAGDMAVQKGQAQPQPTLTLPLSLSLGHDQTSYAQPLVTALTGHLNWQINQHFHSAELQLHPVELGAITIAIHVNNGAMQLHLSADTPTTQQLLQQTANELKESLTLSHGSQVEVDVSSQGHQQRRQSPQPENDNSVTANTLTFADPSGSTTDHSILVTL